MGVVWKALDTTLDREVAIKILPDEFARDPQRLARFEREAKLLAALNHPNIAAIHGLETAEQIRFLVLELVPGQTLAERLHAGPLPLDESLAVCRQIAEALEAAHEQSIIHRDLKPANVKITPEGRVKVLDFGLAKAFEDAPATTPDSSVSPTVSTGGTREGAIMGTAAYMSPEQARGKPLDKRTDIWSFGCVLYECLTGRQTFGGETASDSVAAVLKTDPDWKRLPAEVPVAIRAVVRNCLQRDPHDRLHDIADARIGIHAATDPSRASLAEVQPAPAPWRTRWMLGASWGLVALLLIAVTWLSTGRSRDAGAFRASDPARFSFALPAETPLAVTDNLTLAISPDGSRVVYVGEHEGVARLYVREIDRFEVSPILGTEEANGPFFSPDGEWVGFFHYTAGKLRKVPLRGGGAIDICDAPASSRGASWGTDGVIVFTSGISGGLYTVHADGGAARPLITGDFKKGEKSYRLPQILPDGRTVLCTLSMSDIKSYNEARVVAVSLETGKPKVLFTGGSNPRYVPTGHIVYARAGSLFATPFDLRRLEVTGAPVQILDGVISADVYGSAQFDFSRDGTLVYVPGGPEVYYGRLVWVDRAGNVEPLPIAPDRFGSVQFSPDGQRLAIQTQAGNDFITVYEFERGTMSRLTTGGWDNDTPIWTPDGKRVTFGSNRRGSYDLYWKHADGSGTAELLVASDKRLVLGSWTPDAKLLVYSQTDPETQNDIWVLPVGEEGGEPRPFLRTQFSEGGPELSPDGRWLAYHSDETDRNEVYVQAFPEPSGKWLISTDGGVNPAWSPNGRELFYRDGSKMMVVDVATQPTFRAGAPRVMFEGTALFEGTTLGGDLDSPGLRRLSLGRAYDMAPGGERFVMIQEEQRPVADRIQVVLNWFEDLERRFASVD